MTISVETLRRIFLDIEVTVRRRIEAAEAVLTYECPPEVVEEAKVFLEEISADESLHPELQTFAAKVLLKAEARKVTQPAAASPTGFSIHPRLAEAARRRAQRKAAYQRREAFKAAGLWPAPPGWDADIFSDDWVEPPID